MITPGEMRALEDKAEENGISKLELMENAGRQVFEILSDRYDLKKTFVFFCGHGNNGGDGFVAARLLRDAGASVSVMLYGSQDKLTPESRPNYQKVKELIASEIPENGNGLVFIDAMLGTGGKGKIREPIASGVELFNKTAGEKVSLDMPTGRDSATGKTADIFCGPDMVIAFHDVKTGLDAWKGNVIVADIGLNKLG